MPELDSHKPSLPSNPTPLESPFSPWHACGSNYESYSAGMARSSHLKFISATCRLAPGNDDTEGAARRWQEIFGVEREGSELLFTNMRLQFVRGVDQQPEGLELIVIEVEGEQRFQHMLDIGRKEGLCGDGWLNMLGVKWIFVLKEDGNGKSKL